MGIPRRWPGGSKGEDLETRLTTLDELYHGGSKKIAIDLEGRGTPSELTIKIPPGTKDGMKIRLTGKGRPSRVGGPAGDLLLSVEVRPQAEASVDRFDITLPLKLAPWEAALGGKVEFATIDGSVMLSVPAGVSSGQKMRLKGKGLQKGDGSRGFCMRKFKLRFRRHSRPMSVGSWKSGRIFQRSILGVIREDRYPPDRCDQYTGGAEAALELRVRVFR